jgi:hypothetical protein
VNSVVLLTKGKEIPLENDHLTLRQLGLKPNAQIIISKVCIHPGESCGEIMCSYSALAKSKKLRKLCQSEINSL